MKDLELWLSQTGAEWPAGLMDGVILLIGLVAGIAVSLVIQALLRVKGFDESLHYPWNPSAKIPERLSAHETRARRLTGAELTGYLSGATVWAGAAWLVATRHEWMILADRIADSTRRVWIVTAIGIGALWVAGWLARSVGSILQSPWLKGRLEERFPAPGPRLESFPELVQRAIGLGIYAVVLLRVLVSACEVLGLPTMASALDALWLLGLRVFTAALALGIGWLGVSWVRAQLAVAPPADTVDRLAYHVSLVLVAGAVFLAIVLLAGSASVIVSLCFLLLLVFLFWPLRDYLTDLWSGVLLNFQRFKEIEWEGTVVEVKSIGPLMTELKGKEGTFVRRNREVLSAALQERRGPRRAPAASAPPETARPILKQESL